MSVLVSTGQEVRPSRAASVIVLADEWADVRVGGLRQLERVLRVVGEAVGAAPVLVLRPPGDEPADVGSTGRRPLGFVPRQAVVGTPEAADAIRGLDLERCLVVSTAHVLARGRLANALDGVLQSRPEPTASWTVLEQFADTLPASVSLGRLGTDGGPLRLEGRLFRTLIKPTDGFVARHLNRPMSTSISRLLVRTPVSPNVISVAVLGIAVLSAWLLIRGTPLDLLLGLVVYHLASVVDGCDGEIARVTFRESAFGRWADTIIDKISTHLMTISLGIGLARGSGASIPSSPYFWEGVLSAISMVVLVWWVARTARHATVPGHFGDFGDRYVHASSRSELSRRIGLVIAYAARRDAFAILIIVPAAVGQAEWSLHLIAMGVIGHILGFTADHLRDPSKGRRSSWAYRAVDLICTQAVARPMVWLAGTALITVPALLALGRLTLDTDLTRLLPTDSPAATSARTLGPVVGAGNYLTVLFEGEDSTALAEAVEETADALRARDDIASAQYEYPVDFFSTYRFLLIPTFYLDVIERRTRDGVAAMANADTTGESYGDRQVRRDIQRVVREFGTLPRYHQSQDGRTRGIFVRVRRDLTSLSATRALLADVERIALDAAEPRGLATMVRGSLRNKVDELDVITADLKQAGLVTGAIVLLTLIVSFRSIRPLPVVLLPLAIGLVWGFALVPALLGSLNLITSFLVIVMFGLGVDYSIHLVKRFQLEMAEREIGPALVETMRSTGGAVAVSAVTTALALVGLAVSGFRGFSEFGVVGFLSITTVAVAMLTVMPAALVAGSRLRMLPTIRPLGRRLPLLPTRSVTVFVGIVIAGATVIAVRSFQFDYDFTKIDITVSRTNPVQGRVYTTSNSPGAIYLAPDLEALDVALRQLDHARARPGSLIGRLSSVRDFAPTAEDADRRRELLERIRQRLGGLGSLMLPSDEWRQLAADLRAFDLGIETPAPDAVPEILQAGLVAADGSGQYLIGVFPNVERREGRNTMAFTEELYALDLPGKVLGPSGETAVMAEILWLVTGEGPWLVVLILLGVLLVLFVHRQSLLQTLWILLPLVTGMVLTLGVLIVAGVELNFFNVVVIPALLGLGVDHGVHYYQRWRELDRRTERTQRELLGPLTVCSATTMTGYAGMLFASHAGLRSIATVACIGLAATWFTSLIFLPGALRWREQWLRNRSV